MKEKKMYKPIISIIMPVYNVERYIRKSLQSAIEQTFSDIEIICVNDGSTDGSWRIVEEVSDRDERLKLINLNGNHGQAFARNRGMDIAQGKYIMFLDADDTLQNNAAETLYGEAENNHSEIVVYGFKCDYESEVLKSKYYIAEDDLSIYENQIFDGPKLVKNSEINTWPTLVCWNMFFKRKYLDDHHLRFCEGIIHEDVLFVNICVFVAKRISFCSDKLYVYYRRDASTTTLEPSLHTVRSFFIVFVELMKFFLKNNYPESEYEYIGRRIASYAIRPFMSYQKSKSEISYRSIKFDEDLYNKMFAVFSNFQVSFDRWNITKYDIEKIKSSKYLVVYGAGTIGRAAIVYLSSLGINNFVVAVTQPVAGEYLMGNRVMSIEDIKYPKKDTLILLAVSAKSQKGIILYLNTLGYDEIITMV